MERESIRYVFIDGEDVSKNAVAADGLAIAKEHWSAEHTVDFPEGKEFLKEMVDFDELKNIFVEEYKKMGLSEEELHFVNFDNVHFEVNEDRAFVGRYYPQYGIIIIEKNFLAEQIKTAALSPSDYETFPLVDVCVHEEVHAISGTIVDMSLGGNRVENGLKRSYESSSWSEKVFHLIDEGVTERWAREVTSEYCRRIGKRKETGEMEKINTLIKNNKDIAVEAEGYNLAIHYLEKFMDRIAQKISIPRENLWQAIKRAKVHNKTDDFCQFLLELEHDPDTQTFFPPGSAEKLSKDEVDSLLVDLH